MRVHGKAGEKNWKGLLGRVYSMSKGMEVRKEFAEHRELHVIQCYWDEAFKLRSGRPGEIETHYQYLVWQPVQWKVITGF